MTKERDISIDIIRGIAAFMVVFTHVIQLYGDTSNNIVNNCMLALQIPLFMMVSGYTTKFSKVKTSLKDFLAQIVKRSRVLLIPWISWSLLLYVVYLSKTPFIEHVKYVAYHMEGAYWFLFSLWCLDFIYIIASYFEKRIKATGNYLLFLFFFFIGLFVLVALSFLFDISFLGIKFTLYYSVFFLLGNWLSRDRIERFVLSGNMISNIIVFVCSVVFFVSISKVNVFDLPENPQNILIRVLLSAMGCVMVFYSAKKAVWTPTKPITRFLKWGGSKSLEIYVVHYLLLRIFLKVSLININTVASMIETVLYFIVVLIVTYLLIEVIYLNPFSKMILFGKSTNINCSKPQ